MLSYSVASILQIEGSFIQGIGFFIYEEYVTNSDGLMISNSTWDYKIPSVDIIPKQFNAEVLNTGYHKNRVLSSKGRHFGDFLNATYVEIKLVDINFYCFCQLVVNLL